jgi:hypothetical protein
MKCGGNRITLVAVLISALAGGNLAGATDVGFRATSDVAMKDGFLSEILGPEDEDPVGSTLPGLSDPVPDEHSALTIIRNGATLTAGTPFGSPSLPLFEPANHIPGPITLDDLEAMLKGLGYKPIRIEENGYVFFTFHLATQFNSNLHCIGIDPNINLVTMAYAPVATPRNLTDEGVRFLAQMTPACSEHGAYRVEPGKNNLIVYLDFVSYGLTPQALRGKLDQHTRFLNEVFAPMVRKLQSMTH